MFRTRIRQSVAFPSLRRLVGAAAVVALFGVGMCGLLGYFKFRSAVEAATRSRMAVPAASVRAAVEATLSLGVPLGGETRALLQRERSADAQITEIAVVDAAGRTMASTDPARAGGPLGALPHAVDELRMPLRNSFDQSLGQVVVRYAAASSHAVLQHMRERLVLIVAAGWASTTLLAAAGIVLAARRGPPQG